MADAVNIFVTANASAVFDEIVKQAKLAQAAILKNPPQIKINNNGALKGLVQDANSFTNSISRSTQATLTFGESAAVIYGFTRAMSDLVKTTITVERQLTQIKVLLDSTQSEFQSFTTGLFEAAKQTAQSFATAAGVAEEFARQGLSVQETLKRTKDALILANTSAVSSHDAVTTLTVVMNNFKKETLDTTRVINVLNNVDAAFAVSTQDLAEGLKRAGSTADTVGVSFNELIALITSLQQTTQRGGAVIGNSLKSIFTRELREKSLPIFENVGVQTRDAEGNLRNVIDILKEYAGAEQNLSQAQKLGNREKLAGIFQTNALSALLNDLNSNYSIYNQALTTANKTTDEAIQRNETLKNTLSGVISQVGTGLTQFASSLGNLTIAPALKNILNIGDKLTGALDSNIGAGVGKIFAEGIGNFFSGPGSVLIAAAIGKVILKVAAAAGKQFVSAINLKSSAEGELQAREKINSVINAQNTATQNILTSSKGIEQFQASILSLIKQQITATEALLALQNSFNHGGAGGVIRSIGNPSSRRDAFPQIDPFGNRITQLFSQSTGNALSTTRHLGSVSSLNLIDSIKSLEAAIGRIKEFGQGSAEAKTKLNEFSKVLGRLEVELSRRTDANAKIFQSGRQITGQANAFTGLGSGGAAVFSGPAPQSALQRFTGALGGKLDTGLLGASLAVPFIQAGISNSYGANSVEAARANGAGDALSTGAALSFLIPHPAAKAATVGATAISAILRAYNADKNKFSGFFNRDERFETARDNATIANQSAGSIAQTSTAYFDLQRDSTAPSYKRENARSAVSNALLSVPNSVDRDKLASTIFSNVLSQDKKNEALQDILSSTTASANRDVATASFNKFTGDKLEKGKGFFSGYTPNISQLSKDERSKLSGEIFNSIDLKNLFSKGNFSQIQKVSERKGSLLDAVPELASLEGALSKFTTFQRENIEKEVAQKLIAAKATDDLAKSHSKLTAVYTSAQNAADKLIRDTQGLLSSRQTAQSISEKGVLDRVRTGLSSPLISEEDKLVANTQLSQSEVDVKSKEQLFSTVSSGLSTIEDIVKSGLGGKNTAGLQSILSNVIKGQVGSKDVDISSLISAIQSIPIDNAFSKEAIELQKLLAKLNEIKLVNEKESENVALMAKLQAQLLVEQKALKGANDLGDFGLDGVFAKARAAFANLTITANVSFDQKSLEAMSKAAQFNTLNNNPSFGEKVYQEKYTRAAAVVNNARAESGIDREDLVFSQRIAELTPGSDEYKSVVAQRDAAREKKKQSILPAVEEYNRGNLINQFKLDSGAEITSLTGLKNVNQDIPKLIGQLSKIAATGNPTFIGTKGAEIFDKIKSVNKSQSVEGQAIVDPIIEKIAKFFTYLNPKDPTTKAFNDATASKIVGKGVNPELAALEAISKNTSDLLQPIQAIGSSVEAIRNSILTRLESQIKISESTSKVKKAQEDLDSGKSKLKILEENRDSFAGRNDKNIFNRFGPTGYDFNEFAQSEFGRRNHINATSALSVSLGEKPLTGVNLDTVNQILDAVKNSPQSGSQTLRGFNKDLNNLDQQGYHKLVEQIRTQAQDILPYNPNYPEDVTRRNIDSVRDGVSGKQAELDRAAKEHDQIIRNSLEKEKAATQKAPAEVKVSLNVNVSGESNSAGGDIVAKVFSSPELNQKVQSIAQDMINAELERQSKFNGTPPPIPA